jgi:tRNA(His) guanylyltransferase
MKNQVIDVGTRMKSHYESRARTRFVRRMPIILRLNGKNFKEWTSWCQKPFDTSLCTALVDTLSHLLENVPNAVFGYLHSDKLSILLRDYDDHDTGLWFDGDVQDIISLATSMATAFFNNQFEPRQHPPALFQMRAFNLPREEVHNYFVWRQSNSLTGALHGLGRHHLGEQNMQKYSNAAIVTELQKRDVDLKNLDSRYVNGIVCLRNSHKVVYTETAPNFTYERGLIEKIVYLHTEKT